jgi:hypothetical protein
MATGYEQARSVVAHLAGDEAAASRVELVLPETGVCGGAGDEACCAPQPSRSRFTGLELLPVFAGDASCCGGPALADVEACCALDESAKASGLEGCGCSQKG